jgi:hypothetical protein
MDNSLLPTFLFILAVLGLYALTLAWCRRRNFPFQRRGLKERPRWLALLYGAAGSTLFLGLVFWLAPASQDQKVRLAGVLGVTEGEAWLDAKASPRVEKPPVKEQVSGGQPAYALLHPESPSSLQPPAKPAMGAAPLRKPKVKRAPVPASKKPKTVVKLAKKEKVPAKAKAKKKKTSGTPARSSPGQQDTNG